MRFVEVLLETAFENQFIPDDSFAAILFEMESEIPNGIVAFRIVIYIQI